jgi:glycerol uptake facilitator-like aquaporin
MLLAAIVGSGIMGERLAAGNDGMALLVNSLATGGVLAALILAFRGISGAHFNPVVTLSEAIRGSIPSREVPAYIGAQFAGAFAGTGLANLMFDLPIFFASTRIRTGGSQWLSEAVATFGLVAVIAGCVRFQPGSVAMGVGAYIAGVYWFVASTGFANPAVTVARMTSDTFSGIRSTDVPAFLAAQVMGGVAAALMFRWFDRNMRSDDEGQT